jgi:hypothetical protein
MIVDSETDLEVGDPDKLTFDKMKKLNLSRLQEDIEKHIRFGIASPSGIRQVFDSACGDDYAECKDGGKLL